jgi:hypothetical protein
VEQRAILASFKTQRRDRSAQELMAIKRRAAATRLWRTMMPPAPTPIAAASKRRGLRWQRLSNASFRADVTGGLASVAAERQRSEHQYLLPSFNASAQREEERRTFTSFLEDAERHRHERASE